MPNPNRKMSVSFNAMLDPETDEMLCNLAEGSRVSKASIVREGIRRHYQMLRQQKPQCASGGPCLCPHAHLYPPAITAQPNNPDAYQEAR